MTLFNYDKCPCKNKKFKSVVGLANILPVDVCNLIGGCIKPTCFDCRYLREEEEHFMSDKNIPEEGLEKAELQLNIIQQIQNNDITQLTGYHFSLKHYRKNIDRVFDIQEVKERFKNRKMYYQALKSYCKNNEYEVCVVLKHCLKVEELKYWKQNGFCFPNLNSWWSYRNNNYYLRHILSELIEIYTDQLIKGYEHYFCEYSMSCYSGCIAGEIEYGSN